MNEKRKERINKINSRRWPPIVSGVLLLILVIAVIRLLTGRMENTSREENGETYFQALVLEVREGSILVEPLEGETERNSSSQISVGTTGMFNEGYPQPQKGDLVRIVYNGEIMETFPAQLGRVFAIYLLDENGEIIECTEAAKEDAAYEAKPVIYLYPREAMEVSVSLDYRGELNCTWPVYEDGWQVKAYPDGTIENLKDGREYSYLFWEGCSQTDYDMSKGFVIKGEDTAAFLQEKLELLGLLPREYNEFIVYWLPRMQENPYNLITFQTEKYTEHAGLVITPKPDSLLRVFMVYQPLEEPVSIEEPVLAGFTREGFTVVEWGGAEYSGDR